MIVIEYMENGALDAFLRVSTKMKVCKNIPCFLYMYMYVFYVCMCIYLYAYIHDRPQ